MKKNNKERRKIIVEAMLSAGATNREIAAAIGLKDPSGVSHYIRNHNVIVAKRRGWTDAELKSLVELWESDATMDEIEKNFSYKNIKNLRQAMSRMMYIMRMRGITNAKRTINGIRK